MSQMPKEIRAFRNVWGLEKWHSEGNNDVGLRYVRGDIADEMLKYLKSFTPALMLMSSLSPELQEQTAEATKLIEELGGCDE